MNKYIGCFATSIAGQDHNNIYVIIDADDEYVYLVDGKICLLYTSDAADEL